MQMRFIGIVIAGLLALHIQAQEGPKNVVLLIGDGMGLSQLSTPYFYGKEDPAFDRFPFVGLVRTSSATDPVTQSPAAATAMSTGTKTYNMAVGVGPDSLARENLVELLSARGFQTGIIATSSITDATPAGFYAHQPDRRLHYHIARDLLLSEVDFFAGAGLRYFLDTTGINHFEVNGIVAEFSKLKKIKKPLPGMRYGFLLAMDRMPTMLEGRKDFLKEASLIGMDFLDQGEGGFFMMIEGSQIDWAGHGNQGEYMIREMIDFEESVAAVLDWAEKDGETLVLVTADHETGGFTLGAAGSNGYDADYSVIAPSFASTNHSAAMVPLLAYGPGAENFTGLYENTEIFFKLVSLLATDH